MNITLFNAIFDLSTNSFLGSFAVYLDKFTYPVLAVILILSIIIVKRKFFALSLLFLSGILAWLLAEALKFLFHTSRPFIELGISPLIYQGGFAFPSQHTAVFSALAISMFLVNKKMALILLLLAIVVGISRIVLGVHYPIDIVGGLCAGVISSFVITYFYKKV